MKCAGQVLLCAVFALLFLWSCQALVERPEVPEIPAELPSAPVRAMLRAVSAESPVQARTAAAEGESVQRRDLALVEQECAELVMPVKDGNGIPLGGRSYVRTVYTACRLEETAG